MEIKIINSHSQNVLIIHLAVFIHICTVCSESCHIYERIIGTCFQIEQTNTNTVFRVGWEKTLKSSNASNHFYCYYSLS